MKGLITALAAFLLIAVSISTIHAQQGLVIGANSPNPDAILDVVANDKGVLIPRMTTTQRNSNLSGLNAADEGMLIYNTTTSEFNYWDGGSWVSFPAAGSDGDWDGAGSGTMYPTNLNDDVSIGTTGSLGTLTLERTYAGTEISLVSRMLGTSGTTFTGFSNVINSTGTQNKIGINNIISGSTNISISSVINNLQDNGNATQYAVNNGFSGTGSGNRYGLYNLFIAGTGPMWGAYNNFPVSLSSGAVLYGTETEFAAGGAGQRIGHRVTHSGVGNGTQTGIDVSIANTGSGLKRGVNVVINPGAGGTTQYGIYSSVLKAGANTFAGYFLGDVYIGTNTINGYNLPGTDGTANYIMQTDGSGQATWVDPATVGTDTDDQTIDVLNLSGTTLQVSLEDDGVATQTVDLSSLDTDTDTDDQTIDVLNLSGTTLQISLEDDGVATQTVDLSSLSGSDADWYEEGTTSPPSSNAADIFTNGDVGIGEAAPAARLHVDGGTIPFRVDVSGTETMRLNDETLELINSSRNTLVGEEVGLIITAAGNDNAAVGYHALNANTSGDFNSAFGASSLLNNASGGFNTAVGGLAMPDNTTGSFNSAFGFGALEDLVSGGNNVAVGYNAMNSTNGSNNTAIGYLAGQNNSGSNNVFIGYQATQAGAASNRLVVANSITNPLIYGEFNNGIVRINDELQISDPSTTGYRFPSTDGTTGYLLGTNGTGTVGWVDPATLSSSDNDWNGGGTGTMSPTNLTDDVSIGTTLSQGTLTINRNYSASDISIYNVMSGNSAGNYTGFINANSVSNATTKMGIQNSITGSATSFVYGMQNQMQATGNSTHTALYNNMGGSGSGIHSGVTNYFSAGGGQRLGLHNQFAPAFAQAGTVKGVYSDIQAPGNGNRFGEDILIRGSGVGTKYGVNVYIDNTAGGTHYGIRSEALKAGSWAGYFLGNVYVGTTALNGYRLPSSDGTTNYVMQTNGSGQASWVDPATFGSDDVDWYEEGTTTAPNAITDDIFTQGDVGIGEASPAARLHVDGGTAPLRVDVSGTARMVLQNNTLEFLNTQSGTFIGEDAGDAQTTGQWNTAMGQGAMTNTNTGSSNVAIGQGALVDNTSGGSNVAVGAAALNNNTTQTGTVAIGNQALFENTNGFGNTAIGFLALHSNTTADRNIAVGNQTLASQVAGGFDNVALGYFALNANSTGDDNVGVGSNALIDNTSGLSNIAIGSSTLETNTTGSYNVAIGTRALASTTGNSWNIAIGFRALEDNTAAFNTAVGYNALANNTTGGYNVALGYQAMDAQVVGAANNTGLGADALGANTAGDNNVAVGYQAVDAANGNGNTGVGASALTNYTSSNATAVGYNALGATTSGGNNVAVGYSAMAGNTTGAQNTAVGYEVRLNATTGNRNTIMGYRSMYSATGGNDNVALGYATLQANTTGFDNTAVGGAALNGNTSGSQNTALGELSLEDLTTGSENTALGHAAGRVTNGTGNVYLGFNAGATHNGSNRLYIENSNSTTPLIYGEFNNDLARINGDFEVTDQMAIGTTVTGDALGILFNSDGTNAQIRLTESTANDGARIRFANSAETNNTWVLYGRADNTVADNAFNIFSSNTGNVLRCEGNGGNGLVGIAGRNPTTNALEVNGQASKSAAGGFIANSDARLKKNIESMDSYAMLQKVLSMRGVTYEWNDDKTGYDRPDGVQYGFIAQDLQKIWPSKVEEDADGYLQTAYGDYDAMFVEAFKAQQELIEQQKTKLAEQEDTIAKILERLENLEDEGRSGVQASR